MTNSIAKSTMPLAIVLIFLMLGPIMLECRQRGDSHEQQQEQEQQQQQLQHEYHHHHHHMQEHRNYRNADSLRSSSDYDSSDGIAWDNNNSNNNKNNNNNNNNNNNGDDNDHHEQPPQQAGRKKNRRRNGNADYDMNGGRRGGGGRRRGHGRKRGHRKKQHHQMEDNDISLWIGEKQFQMLSALFLPHSSAELKIYAIDNGHVLNHIRDVSIYKYLIIPSEVNYVNFTWKAGTRKYHYHFDRLETMDDSILQAPTISIETKGRIPQKAKDFSIFLPCKANSSGTAMFNIGLSIKNGRDRALPGTPLRLSLKKDCAHRGAYDKSIDAYASNPLTTSQEPDPYCQLKCGTNGICNTNKVCQCKAGYTGQYCQRAVCFPACMNGGNCTAPFECTCPPGYQGSNCEGGICREKCQNGGKCIQKDKCHCTNGYYGLRCEYSKCVVPCMNGGRCTGPNTCRCPNGLRGFHCEIGLKERSTCKPPCRHGTCKPGKKCDCDKGFYGRSCAKRLKNDR